MTRVSGPNRPVATIWSSVGIGDVECTVFAPALVVCMPMRVRPVERAVRSGGRGLAGRPAYRRVSCEVASLRDDVFLLAHDDAGRLVGSEASIGAGLAGATLIELLLAGRVAVVDGRLDVIDSARHRRRGDRRDPGGDRRRTPRRADRGRGSSWIADGAYERVADGLRRGRRRPRATTGRRLGLVPVQRLRAGRGRGPGPGAGPGAVRAARPRTCPTRRPRRCAAWSGCCGWSRRCCCSMPTSDLLLAAGADGRRQRDHRPAGDQRGRRRDHRRHVPVTAAPNRRRRGRSRRGYTARHDRGDPAP